MPHLAPTEQLIRLLLDRLERISVDSHWAHRAGGVRGSLLASLEEMENGEIQNEAGLNLTLTHAFKILELAARERAR
jgi:hypothetical protein